MERKVRRKKVLPAFRIDTAELGVLWKRMRALFETPAEVHCTFEVRLQSEQLTFSDIEEFNACQNLPAVITQFSISFHQNDRNVYINCGAFLTIDEPEVRADSETEAWCAGTVETVLTFFNQHKVWYHWFIAAPIGRAAIFLPSGGLIVFIIGQSFFHKDIQVPPIGVFGFFTFTFVLALLYQLRARFFPVAAVVVRQDQGWMERKATVLVVVLMAITIVITIIGWFVPK